MEFFTIGVLNSTEEEFFGKLKTNNIDTFCDIRQRRGIRNVKYTFVNSTLLQEKLRENNIRYLYIPELAPTTELREIQKQKDKKSRESINERRTLDKLFMDEYINKRLKEFDIGDFINSLKDANARNIVLFCVEENPEGCHRSLVAEHLRDKGGFRVTNL